MDLLVKNAEGDRHVPTYQNAVSSSRKSREMATSMFIPCMMTAGGQSHDLGSSLHFGSHDPHTSPTHLAVSDVLVVAAEGDQNVLQLRSLWGKERHVSDPRPEPGPRGAVGPTPCPPILKCRLLGRVRKRSNWICFSAEVWITTNEKPHAKSQALLVNSALTHRFPFGLEQRLVVTVAFTSGCILHFLSLAHQSVHQAGGGRGSNDVIMKSAFYDIMM